MNKLTYLVVCLLFGLSLISCGEEKSGKQKKARADHLVETAIAKKSNVGVTLTRTGTLRARREVKVYNQEEGRVIKLPFYEGDRVKKNELVVRLDDKLIRAQLSRAEATRRKAEQDLKRTRDLYNKKLVSGEGLASSETELEVAKADEQVLVTRLSYAKIRSPIDGVVSQRLTEPGNVAERYSHLLTISDPTSLITEVSISELLLPHLSLGDPARVRIDALGTGQFGGQIIRIHPNLNPVTRRGTIEVELKPVPDGARPGQLCRVQLDTRMADRLMIPFRALRRDSSGEYVYLIDQKSRVKRSTVESGQRVAEDIEILIGLSEGQQVVTKGFLGLKDGKKIKQVGQAERAVEEPVADNLNQ